MALTPQQKIQESMRRRKEREITPERQRQIEAAERTARAVELDQQKQATAAARQSAKSQEELNYLRSLPSSPDTQRKIAALQGTIGARQNFQQIAKTKATEQSVMSEEFRGQLDSGFGRRTGRTREGEFFAGAKGSEKSGTAQSLSRPGEKVDIDGDFADQLRNEIGSIDPEDGPTQEQQKAIKAIEDFNTNFNLQQKQTEEKTQAQLRRGSFTGGEPVSQLFQQPTSQPPTLEGAPDVFQQQVALAGGIQEAELQTAEAQFQNQEALREQKLRSSLSALSLGDEQGNVLSALEGKLGQLSLPQLEALAGTNGLELTQSLKDSLTRDGKSAIEREQMTKQERLAENAYSQKQLAREYGRAITDREEFNLQQDARLRRLAASFGDGKTASLGANVSIMKEAEKGMQAVTELRESFSDKTMMVSRQADSIINTYNGNVSIIQSQMSEAIENKYAEITNTIDDLLSAGVTNQTELNNAILKAKKDYMKTYSDVSVKAFEAIQKQNETFFNQQIKLKELQQKENQERQQGIFGGGIFGGGQPRSTMTTNTGGMQIITPPPSKNGANCVLFCREQVPNLPFGLFTKADKKRAIEQVGFRDPSQLQPGDAVLTAEGDVGHAAIFKGYDSNGNLILEEANYKPGQITTGRTISPDDANIYGFISSNGKPPANIGGNIQLEGTNTAIQNQVNQMYAQEIGMGQFSPQILDAVNEFKIATDSRKSEIMQEARQFGLQSELQRALEVSSEQEAFLTAQDIMSGNSFLTLKDMPQKERAAVSRQLNLLKEQAKQNGDILGYIKASAGGDDLSDTAITKFEKTLTVLNQVGSINQKLTEKKIESSVPGEEGRRFDISPLTGYIKKRNPWSLEAQELNAMLQGTIPNLARGVFGEVGVLTDRDVELYRKTLPNLSQPADIQKSITGITLRVLRDSIGNQLKVQAAAGKDVSGFADIYEDVTAQINQIESELGIDSSQGAAENGIIGNIQTGSRQVQPIQVAPRIDTNALRKQLKNPTPAQKQEIAQAKQSLQGNEKLVLRPNQNGELKFTAIGPDELLSTDIEL